MLNGFLRFMGLVFVGFAMYMEYHGAPLDRVNNAMLWGILNVVMSLT